MTTAGWQRLEGALVLAGGGAALVLLASWVPLWPWWALGLLFLAPDLSMLGYLAGPRTGAAAYNAVHLYGAGLILVVGGFMAAAPMAVAAGILWAAHVGFDRMLGYGLKERTAFGDTHLGRIGRR